MTFTGDINPDAVVDDMLEGWINGNRADTVQALANDHPGLAVFFVVEGIRRKVLNVGDVNRITNALMDHRKAIIDGQGP